MTQVEISKTKIEVSEKIRNLYIKTYSHGAYMLSLIIAIKVILPFLTENITIVDGVNFGIVGSFVLLFAVKTIELYEIKNQESELLKLTEQSGSTEDFWSHPKVTAVFTGNS